MTTVYLLKNQHNEYLEKSGEWAAVTNTKSLYRSQYKDEVVNQKVEIAMKNIQLRIEIVETRLAENGTLTLNHTPDVSLDHAV